MMRLPAFPLPEVCEKCGRRGRVIKSRKLVGYRRRRRQCKLCGHRWNEYTSRLNPGRVLQRIRRRLPAVKTRSIRN